MPEQQLIQWTLTPSQVQLLSEALLGAAMIVQEQPLIALDMLARFRRHYKTIPDAQYDELCELIELTAKEACECDECEEARNES